MVARRRKQVLLRGRDETLVSRAVTDLREVSSRCDVKEGLSHPICSEGAKQRTDSLATAGLAEEVAHLHLRKVKIENYFSQFSRRVFNFKDLTKKITRTPIAQQENQQRIIFALVWPQTTLLLLI